MTNTKERVEGMNQTLPLKRISRTQSIPLTVEQYRLWFLSQLEPNSIHFNINLAFRINGELKSEILEKSLNDIVSRHDTLRTVFQSRGNEPEQIVLEKLWIPIQNINLSKTQLDDRESHAITLMNEEIQKPFSLETGPLLSLSLYQLGDEDQFLLFKIHHIIADFVSLEKLIKELGFFYNSYVEESLSPLSPLPIQYVDYAYWQQQNMKGNVYQKQLNYWKEKLGSELPVLKMPLDYSRPVVMTHNGERMRMTIPADITTALKELSRKNGVTMFITMLAAYQTLLYRYTGQEDICVGTSISSRNLPELQDLIGLLANTLVLRNNLEGDPTFLEMLKRTRKVAFGAFAHKDIPYETLIQELQTERNMSHNPFFQTMLTYLTAQDDGDQPFQGVTMKTHDFQKKASALELSFTITEQNDELICSMDFNTDLFNSDTIQRLLTHFLNLLQACIDNPQQLISEIKLLPETEEQQLVEDWSGRNKVKQIPEASVHELFSQKATSTPDAIALRFQDQYFTYRELDERSNQLANYLIKRGLGPHKLVGICMNRSLDMVVGLLGILKAGNAYVPIDPSYPQERKAFMVNNSEVEILLTVDSEVENLNSGQSKVISIENEWKLIERESREAQRLKVESEDLIYVIYTSGSTGKPKGVMVSHKGVVNHCLNIIDRFELNPQDRVLQFTSISFDVAVQEIFPTLLAGATLVLWKDKYISEGREFLKWIEQEKISVLNMTTAYWSSLVADLKNDRSLLPTSLKLVIVGGEKVSPETFVTWKNVTDGSVRWINDYGLTETTITATMFEPDAAWNPQKVVPIGTPLDNVEIYILDKNQNPVPIGVYGELYIGGIGLAKGYWGRPELTKERFVQNYFSENLNDRLYKTGDQARFLSDGTIEFLGRLDDQVKIRGYRIEIGEIEAAIEQYGKISQSVVVPFELANGNKQLAGYVVLSDSTVSIDELRNFLKSRLPDYMIPSHFVVMDQIPLTVNGKLDEAALPKPELYAIKSKEYVAPRTPTEQIAVSIWTDLLDYPDIGVMDNFFEVGGNSLLATQVVSRATNTFECNIPLRVLFEYPILTDWVAEIERLKLLEASEGTKQNSEKCIVKIQQKGEKTPIFFVHPVGGTISCYLTLARQLGENQPFYALQGHGFVDANSKLDSVEMMAEHYLKEILEVQPEGPYRLGGWSMGGFIAYEIASKLKENGHEVTQLVVIDSYMSKVRNATDDFIFYNFIRQLAALSGKTISDSIITSWQKLNVDQASMVKELEAFGLVPPGTSTDYIRLLIDVYKTTARAFHKYIPAKRPKLEIENVQLFRAEDSPVGEGIWTELVTSITLHQMIADHFSIVHHPALGDIVNTRNTEIVKN
jgi:amino acid adenylation domain-containing protein